MSNLNYIRNKLYYYDVILIYLVLLVRVRYVNGASLFSLIIFSFLAYNCRKKFSLFEVIIFYLTFGFAFFSFLANIFFQNPIVFDYLNVEEYLFFTPLIYIVCSANNGIFLKKIIRFTSKWSIFLFLISVVIFLNRGYEFSLVPNVLYRFNLEVKGNLFGPIILLGFFPVTLFSLVINKSFKINFSCLFLVLGILFILYFGYLTLTRSLVFVLFYFVSFILLYTNKYFRLIIYPIVLSSIYWLVNLVISLRVEEQDFSSGRNDELIEFYNYLDSNQIFYFVSYLVSQRHL
jgi:hypothetical protein